MPLSFVAPTIILAATVWIASKCFFESEEQLFHTESLYSSCGYMYFFSGGFLLTLNLRTLRDWACWQRAGLLVLVCGVLL